MITRSRMTFIALAALPIVTVVAIALTGRVTAQTGGEERLEAGTFIEELTTCWGVQDYEQARDLIDAKLLSKPGWLPAVILKSTYLRYIEGDSAAAMSVLQSVEGTVSSLDPDGYANFLGAYALYTSALANEGSFTQQEKDARLELANDIFSHFPGAEIVALYFAPVTQ